LTIALAGTIVKLVVASAEVGTKDSGRGGVDVDEEVTSVGSISTRDPPVEVETTYTREASVLDVALVLGCTRVVDRETVCGLLTECLHDVSSIAFVVHLLVVCSLAFNIRLFFAIGCFFDEGH
jgi:hypothetical protein